MAEVSRYLLSISLIDGVNRTSVVQYYVSPTDGKAYVAAADAAARAATSVGALILAVTEMTDMQPLSWALTAEFEQDSPGPIPDDILRGNKLSFTLRSGGRNITTTIPGRKTSAYTQAVDSLNVALDTPTAMDNFVTAVNATVKDLFGNAVIVTKGKVDD